MPPVGFEPTISAGERPQAAHLLKSFDKSPQYILIKVPTINFTLMGSVHRKNILIYIQKDATLHSLFYLETALHISGGNSTHHQERKQLYLQHLVFITLLLLPAAIVEGLEQVLVCCGWRTQIAITV